MRIKQCLESQLIMARQFSESFLADFKTPEQWTHQVYPGANHALWFAGHMGVADNYFISLMAPEKAKERPLYSEKFGIGSQPSGDADDYPPIEEVLAYMRQRRETLLELLAGFTEEDLNKTTPEGTPDFFGDYSKVLEMALWHEGLHSGQLSVARRAMGHGPVFQPPASV